MISSSGHALRRGLSTSAALSNKDAFIVGAARTPIGSFRSSLASVTAPELASVAIKAALERGAVKPSSIQEVFLGQVCQANVGQAPARQAALGAGLDLSVAVTTVNKVCSSGLKAIILAAQQIQTGHQDLAIGGGMESMSQVPLYVPRGEIPYGGFQVIDGIVKDGLTDAYDKIHMGNCGEKTSKEMGITRKDQDDYAISSYKKAAEAWKNGSIGPEVVPVNVKSKKGVTIVDKDEEFTKVNFEKFNTLRTVFQKDGTITAANASTLNDGAAAVIVASKEAVSAQNLKPLARILAYGDAATHPLDFAVAPTMMFPKILERAGVKQSDVAQWEVNEAFSCVPLAFIKKLGVDASLVNPHGGAVSIGHPIGMSGARLITHLVHTLKSGEIGVAAICNGGGGSSGMVIQKL
ncbi:unnamed protein product [Caenorhabditis nigoni]